MLKIHQAQQGSVWKQNRDSACPALDLFGPWWLCVIWGNDSNYGAGVLLSRDRALSGGMVSMAIASASEWLPVTTSWWFNEFITEFQRKTREWMSYCSALQVPKSIAGRAIRMDNCSAPLCRQPEGLQGLRASQDWIGSHMACEGLSFCYSRSMKASCVSPC